MNEYTWMTLSIAVGLLIGGVLYTHPIIGGIVGFVVGYVIANTPRSAHGLRCDND